jgi:hypothetical protein
MDYNLKCKVQGDLGEEMGYWFVKFYIHSAQHLTQSDFVTNDKTVFEAKLIYKKNNAWNLVEIKHKDPLKYGNFIGTGLNEYQLEARLQFYNDTKIDCLFIVFEKTGKNIYYQYLSKLNEYKEFTKSGIVVFDYKYFNKISKQNLFDKLKEFITDQRRINKTINISNNLFKLINIPNNVEYNVIKKTEENKLKNELLIKYKKL